MKPTASIIIPTYNAANTLEQAINSCLSQTYQNIEIIVVDDGSEDNTPTLVQKFLSDTRVKYFRQNNKGRSAARNFGIENSTGKYLSFLDSDDLLLPEKIAMEVDYLENNPSVFAAYTGAKYFNDTTKLTIRSINETENIEFNPDLLALKNTIPIQSVLLRKTAIRFEQERSACEDWLFFIEAMYGKKVWQLGTIQSEVRVDKQSNIKYIARMAQADISIYRHNFFLSRFKNYRIQLATMIAKRCAQILYYNIKIIIERIFINKS